MSKQDTDGPDQNGIMQQFRQQLMKAWQPIPTLKKTIIIFASLGAVFITVGILVQVYSDHITEFYVDYNNCTDDVCTYQINITRTLYPPVFVFYELHNFYQNHRLYVASTNLKQLKGNYLPVGQLSSCTPIITNADLYTNTSINNTTLNASAPAFPCGLIAFSVFNDTYQISNSTQNLIITSQGIAWPSDKKLYQPVDPNLMWHNTSDQRFMVWMRIAALPNFRKVWGRINSEVSPGIYNLSIQNKYNVSQFGASKKFLLAESNEFGSKNLVMSISYLTVGAACIVFTIVFGIMKIQKMRRLKKQRQQQQSERSQSKSNTERHEQRSIQ